MVKDMKITHAGCKPESIAQPRQCVSLLTAARLPDGLAADMPIGISRAYWELNRSLWLGQNLPAAAGIADRVLLFDNSDDLGYALPSQPRRGAESGSSQRIGVFGVVLWRYLTRPR